MTHPVFGSLLQGAKVGAFHVLGIDLGTTNSSVATIVWNPDNEDLPSVQVLEIEQQTREGAYTNVTVPSVVAVHGTGVLVGKGAKDLRALGYATNRTVFYETKNYIGTSRTYPSGEAGLRSPVDVAAAVLRFLKEAAAPKAAPARVVVTVPASFNTAQRADTTTAALNAGLSLGSGDLLDEPVAAFLDELMTRGAAFVERLDRPRTLVVFDFGGGTCDIALFRIALSNVGTLDVSPLSVSRYHRLGGGDIDAGIVHESLIPQLIEQNGLAPFDLGWAEKKQQLEPALLAVAETLKIKLSKELQRLHAFDHPLENVSVRQPGTYKCRLANRELVLRTPTLSVQELNRILEPLLDPDALYPIENDFRSIQSIFLPLDDALDRSNLLPEQVDFCLLVGGSSLLLPVQQALKAYLPGAELMVRGDEFMQTAVARGAAWHAFAHALTGQGLIRSVVHDAISIRTAEGRLVLVPQGSPLPFPENQLENEHILRLPETVGANKTLPLRVEILGGDERILTSSVWNIQGPLPAGTALTLRASMDLNAVLHLDLRLGEQQYQVTLENPNTHTVNPGEEREESEQLETDLRLGRIPMSQQAQAFDRLARCYGELDQNERAIEMMKRSLRLAGRPDASKLMMLGLNDRIRNYAEMEKRYREAAALSPTWRTPLFNLAFSFRERKEFKRGLEVITETLQIERSLPVLTLAVQLARQAKHAQGEADWLPELKTQIEDAHIPTLSSWELSWANLAGNLTGNSAFSAQANEQRRLLLSSGMPKAVVGLLPATDPLT